MPFSQSSTNIYGNHKLAGLDHLRALAIVMVLLFHYRLFGHPEWLDGFGKFGWTGVDLFFVLSGYLISSQLFSKMAEGKKISFKVFFHPAFFQDHTGLLMRSGDLFFGARFQGKGGAIAALEVPDVYTKFRS